MKKLSKSLCKTIVIMMILPRVSARQHVLHILRPGGSRTHDSCMFLYKLPEAHGSWGLLYKYFHFRFRS